MPEITEKLFDSVNETAKIARASLLFFLVVTLYLLIIVGTTTDLMLLRGEIVALPLMEVGVPVVAFYSVAPLIFLLLHSNLLWRLSQLTRNVSRWKKDSDGLKDDHSSLVFPLDFALLLLDGKPRLGLWVIVVTQIYILPIVVLLALQMSFLAYQSSEITGWHQRIVTIDLVLLLLFLLVSFVISTREKRKVERNHVLKMLQMSGRVFLASLVLISASLVFIFTWDIAVVPNSGQETMETVGMNADDTCFAVDDSQERSIQQQLSACLQQPVACLQQPVACQRQLSAWIFADWWWKEDYKTSYRPVRRFLDVSEQLIVLKEVPPEIVGKLITKEETELKGEEGKFKGKETELKVEEAKPDPLCKYIGELDLSGRQLKYARFYGSQFRCVKLESAELRDADLRLTKLHGANLSKANLHGADLQLTELHYADLSNAKLHGADLFGAELYGADLFEAELYGADLWFAELHGANLFKANLHGADLSNAKLYSAYLSEANLHSASLLGAKLYGADLEAVMLKNTDLSDVSWKMSNIDNGNKIRISSIRNLLKKRGLSGDEINKALLQVEKKLSKISSTGFCFILPTTPVATDCVVHSGQCPFKEWPIPAEGCDIKLASSLACLACQNQWTAKGIVNRVTNEKSIENLIKVLDINRLTNRKSIEGLIKDSGIVIRDSPIKDINLINALLNKDCPVLRPHGKALSKALNDKYKKLNQ